MGAVSRCRRTRRKEGGFDQLPGGPAKRSPNSQQRSRPRAGASAGSGSSPHAHKAPRGSRQNREQHRRPRLRGAKSPRTRLSSDVVATDRRRVPRRPPRERRRGRRA
eukprot:1338172-Prymnesium_polylepis.1